jgi:hypothetical protein
VKPQARVRFRTAEYGRNPRAVEVVPSVQEKHFAIIRGESVERSGHIRRELRREHLLCLVRRAIPLKLEDEVLPAALRSAEVEADVPGDRDQPRPRVFRHLVESPPSHDERLSGDVIRDLRVTTPGVAPNDLEVLLVEPRVAALGCLGDQLSLQVGRSTAPTCPGTTARFHRAAAA